MRNVVEAKLYLFVLFVRLALSTCLLIFGSNCDDVSSTSVPVHYEPRTEPPGHVAGLLCGLTASWSNRSWLMWVMCGEAGFRGCCGETYRGGWVFYRTSSENLLQKKNDNHLKLSPSAPASQSRVGKYDGQSSYGEVGVTTVALPTSCLPPQRNEKWKKNCPIPAPPSPSQRRLKKGKVPHVPILTATSVSPQAIPA